MHCFALCFALIVVSDGDFCVGRQEELAKGIEDIGYEARNTSNNAYQRARKAVSDLGEISTVIKVRSVALCFFHHLFYYVFFRKCCWTLDELEGY